MYCGAFTSRGTMEREPRPFPNQVVGRRVYTFLLLFRFFGTFVLYFAMISPRLLQSVASSVR